MPPVDDPRPLWCLTSRRQVVRACHERYRQSAFHWTDDQGDSDDGAPAVKLGQAKAAV